MTVAQDRMRNPFGMDETCPACAELVESRSRVVHGYGDVGAEFVFVAEHPIAIADATGVPIPATEPTDPVVRILDRLGFLQADQRDSEDNPIVTNAFLTHLTRCRHPDRGPTSDEIENCEAFLSAEIRTINPEVLIPIGDRAFTVVAEEYTTADAAALRAEDHHATPLRGRGFELVPMVEQQSMSTDNLERFVETMAELMDRDYRQTKGRQGR